MKVGFDFEDIIRISTDKVDNVYIISIVFKDEEVMTYGYLDKDKYSKDFVELVSNIERIK